MYIKAPFGYITPFSSPFGHVNFTYSLKHLYSLIWYLMELYGDCVGVSNRYTTACLFIPIDSSIVLLIHCRSLEQSDSKTQTQ